MKAQLLIKAHIDWTPLLDHLLHCTQPTQSIMVRGHMLLWKVWEHWILSAEEISLKIRYQDTILCPH